MNSLFWSKEEPSFTSKGLFYSKESFLALGWEFCPSSLDLELVVYEVLLEDVWEELKWLLLLLVLLEQSCLPLETSPEG